MVEPTAGLRFELRRAFALAVFKAGAVWLNHAGLRRTVTPNLATSAGADEHRGTYVDYPGGIGGLGHQADLAEQRLRYAAPVAAFPPLTVFGNLKSD